MLSLGIDREKQKSKNRDSYVHITASDQKLDSGKAWEQVQSWFTDN